MAVPFDAGRSRHPCVRRVAVLLAVLAATLTGCGTDDPGRRAPAGAYDHAPAREVSTATPIPSRGPAHEVTKVLTGAGWFCAQVRSNADGSALWCRTARRDGIDTVDVQQAHLLLDRRGRLAWAAFPPPDDARDPAPYVVAAAAALSPVWPGAAERVRREIDDLDRDQAAKPVPQRTEVPRTTWHDDHANYAYSVLDGLVAAARDTSVRRWPFGAEHYGTRMSDAVSDLRAGGYDCAYPPQTSCNRTQSNGYFRVTLRGDRIVTAAFGIGTVMEHGRQKHPLTEEFPRGLTFLTAAVRAPVTAQLERCRRTGTSFAGIIAGTVVVVDVRRAPAHSDDFAGYADVRIGTPLPGA